jgi:translation initiation factor IF-1
MDLYIFCLVLGAAGMAAMAFLGFTSSHSGGHHGHHTSGHEIHGVGGSHSIGAGHGHSAAPGHGHAATPSPGIAHGPSHHTVDHIRGQAYDVTHYPIASGHGELHEDAGGWMAHVWSWLSPRVLFNVLVGFGATGLVVERLVGPFLALPIALVGGIAFESVVVRPIFNSLFRFESQPAQTLESALMSEGRAVTGFDANGNGLISLELGGEVVQVLGTQLNEERKAGVRIRAGDIVRIEDVDDARNRCTVSRIGLGETESHDADRY